jgi:hypothetical protein
MLGRTYLSHDQLDLVLSLVLILQFSRVRVSYLYIEQKVGAEKKRSAIVEVGHHLLDILMDEKEICLQKISLNPA